MQERAVISSSKYAVHPVEICTLISWDYFGTSFLFFSIETTGVESHSNIPPKQA